MKILLNIYKYLRVMQLTSFNAQNGAWNIFKIYFLLDLDFVLPATYKCKLLCKF